MYPFIDLDRITKKIITPEKYVSLSEEERSNVESFSFIPPGIGSKGFGHFVAVLKNPFYAFTEDRKHV